EPTLVSLAAPEANAEGPDTQPGPFSSMGPRVRLALVMLAAALGLGLLAPVLLPHEGAAGWAASCGPPVVVCSLLGLLTVLHGHATGCPRCGTWWSRRKERS